MKPYKEFLAQLPLFGGVGQDKIEPLIKALGAQTNRFVKDETLLWAGAEAERFGIILEGCAQVLREGEAGDHAVVTQLEAGELFAEVYACVGKSRLPVSVRALSDGVVLWLRPDVENAAAAAPGEAAKFFGNLAAVLAQKNLLLGRRIGHLTKRTTREKLLSYLEEQARAEGKAFTVALTRQQLADHLCVERSAMCAVLSKLRQEGVLEVQGKNFLLKCYDEER